MVSGNSFDSFFNYSDNIFDAENIIPLFNLEIICTIA